MEVVSNVYPFLPKLTVNGQFIRDFIAAESPCFALGLVEERKQLCGFLALRLDEMIPRALGVGVAAARLQKFTLSHPLNCSQE
jgi:hypothetical protein